MFKSGNLGYTAVTNVERDWCLEITKPSSPLQLSLLLHSQHDFLLINLVVGTVFDCIMGLL